MNAWIAHVKRFQAEHGCSYKEALKGASATYQRGSGWADPSKNTGQMYTKGGNLKKTSKAQLKRLVEALGDKAVQKLVGMGKINSNVPEFEPSSNADYKKSGMQVAKMHGYGAVGNMLKESAANNTVRLMDSGTNRATSEMETRGTSVNRLKKAGRWEQFANATIRDGIDTAGKASRVYYDSTGPMAQMGFGLKKHRRLRGKALMPAGSY